MSFDITVGELVIEVSIGEGAAILEALATENTRATGAEAALTGRVNNAYGAIAANSTAITSEINRATTAEATKVSKAGDTMSGELAMGDHRISGVGTPLSSPDAANKGYVDTAVALTLPKTGGTLSGGVNMGNNRIEALGAPDSADDAVPRGYVDAAISGIAGSSADNAAALQTNINNEASRAQAAESGLSTAITAAIATIRGGVASAYDTLSELATALATEVTNRIAGDAAINANLGTEQTNRISRDNELSVLIGTEVNNRLLLSTDVEAEVNARIAGEATINGNLTTEFNARVAGDAANGTAIANEVNARISLADAALADRQYRQAPLVPVAYGARGTVMNAYTVSAGGFLRYDSQTECGHLPWTIRPIVRSGQVLDTTTQITGFISYGQSWRAHALPISPAAYGIARNGDGRALTIATASDTDAAPPVGIDYYGSHVGDFKNLSFDLPVNHDASEGGANIGWVAAQTFVRLADVDGYHTVPVVDQSSAYPAERWPALKPGGTSTDGAGNHPWATGTAMRSAMATMATAYGKTIKYLGVGWTHGAYDDGFADADGTSDYYTVLTSMVAAYDAANVNGSGGTALQFFIDQTAPSKAATKAPDNVLRQADFARANAGRVHLIGPRYPYPFDSASDPHHTAFGYWQIGVLEGFAKHVVHTLGYTWTMFEITAIARSGLTVTLTTSAPNYLGGLAIDTTLIEAAAQYGFHLRKVSDGTEIAVTGVALSGNTIALTLAGAPVSGTAYELSYAFRRAAGVADVAGHAGTWGNIKRIGRACPWIVGRTIDVFLAVYKTTFTA